MASSPAMMLLFFTVLGLLVPLPAAHYVLQDNFTSANFLSEFSFNTADYCGCQGAANFTTQSQATQLGLIRAVAGQPIYIGVDPSGTYSDSGRPTVSVQSNKVYTGGLIIGDFAHMPTGCGTWPAFWTYGPYWPYGGEIDIIEGVNTNTGNLMTLHTQQGCNITASDAALMSGTVSSYDCFTGGCSVNAPDNSFGAPFNQAGGGVYATEWNATANGFIKIWSWPRGSIPADVTANTPNPSTWGEPWFYKSFGPSCPSTDFTENNIVVDIYLCGGWAGNYWVWLSCAGSTGVADCNTYVQNNPGAFTEAYWSINYIQVYQSQPGC